MQMTIGACEAVYENGVFRPVAASPQLAEGQRVRLIVEPANETTLDLAAKVYQGLTEEQVDEIEQIALDRKPFFGRADI
jgi:predicted DNA-binding antitoxin AbrB/MazE fold protein